jgi:hypothetical protein
VTALLVGNLPITTQRHGHRGRPKQRGGDRGHRRVTSAGIAGALLTVSRVLAGEELPRRRRGTAVITLLRAR